jgi:hypothetical protein
VSQTLIAAFGAFLGATVAQIASHFLQLWRERRSVKKREKQLFDAVREELRLALRENLFLVQGIKEKKKDHHIFVSDVGVPPFKPTIAPLLRPDDPLHPRALVTLATAYSELDAVSAQIRATGNRKRLNKHVVNRTYRSFDYVLSVYTAYLKASDSYHIPYSYEITDDDKQRALTLAEFLKEEPFIKIPNLAHLNWVELDESDPKNIKLKD